MPRSRIVVCVPWLFLALFASCKREPVSVEAAMAICEDRALQAAASPKTAIGFGFNSAGEVRTGFAISATTDYISGRRPAEVFETCVLERSGEPPTRTLAEQLGERIN
ncbi:MAG: hypothetical protein OXI87_21445 [Albidovulum sp.]|nr:hypothetical protein [Albidovulum sp.]MDE0533936.1 hypothetical protein [Albidovulum sp.]